ncbi:MAG: hypothetical protein ACYDH2_07080 [Anaerolineaceae bacterium]
MMTDNTDALLQKLTKSTTLATMQLYGEIPSSCIRPECSGRVVKKGHSTYPRYKCNICKTEYIPLNIPTNQPLFALVIHPGWLNEHFPKNDIVKFQKAVIRREAQRLVIDIQKTQKEVNRLMVLGMGGVLVGFLSAMFLLPDFVNQNISWFGGIALFAYLLVGFVLVIKNNKLGVLKTDYSSILEKKWIYGTEEIYEIISRFFKETREE